MVPSYGAWSAARLALALALATPPSARAFQWAGISEHVDNRPRDAKAEGSGDGHEYSGETSLAATGEGRVEVDMCAVHTANAKPLEWQSYGLSVASKPHLSSLLCDSGEGDEAPHGSMRRQALIFKVARSGSTWLTALLQQAGLQTFFEPFCESSCFHKNDRDDEEQAIRTLMTHSCSKWESKCHPATADNCGPPRAGQTLPATAIAINPRFTDRVRWSSVLQGGNIDAEIVNLRRTNLVSMAYSKFHHGGCAPQPKGGKQKFDLPMLLACVWNYAIGDQELASYTAVWAAASRGRKPLLLLYEDVVNSGPAMETQILEPLGVKVPERRGDGLALVLDHRELDPLDPANTSRWGKRLEASGSEVELWEVAEPPAKLHSSDICQYSDVQCESLRHSLMPYPCLRKQLEIKSASVAWSMPMLPNRTISLRGDCKPLSYLRAEAGTKKPSRRTYSELYQTIGASSASQGKIMVYRDMEQWQDLRRRRDRKRKTKDEVKKIKAGRAAKARRKDFENLVSMVSKAK